MEDNNEMKILLIGKNGQVGREIVAAAKRQNLTIFTYDHSELDILNSKKLKTTILKHSPDIVINTAAYHVIAQCEVYPEKAFAINVFASKVLADICREKGIRLVTFSTDKVFDGTKKTPYREGDRPNPLQMYGISEYARESVTLHYNPDSIVIRTCGIFGGKQGSVSKKGNFILYILSQAKTQASLEIASDHVASIASASDLAGAILRLINIKKTSGIYHLVNEGYTSWAEYAEEIVKFARLQMKIIRVKRGSTFNGLTIPLFAPLKNIRAREVGIVLPSWRDGLRRYVSFLRST